MRPLPNSPESPCADSLHELAVILARGIIRLRRSRLRTSAATSPELSESAPQGLELPPATRLSVTRG